MKQTKKRAVKFLLAAFALISAFGAALTVNAAAPSLSAGSVTVTENGYADITLKGVKTNDLKKNKVAYEVRNNKEDVAYVDVFAGEKKNSFCTVHVYGSKKGTAKVTIIVKYGKNLKKQKKLKLNVKVKKAAYPCASFKIGKKDYASEFKKINFYGSKDLSGKKKFSVKAKKGWKVVEILAWKENSKGVVSKKIKNNQKIDFSKYQEIAVQFQDLKTKSYVSTGVYKSFF